MWHEAARFGLYTWKEFQELDGDEMSDCIAHYLTHGQIEAVQLEDKP
jgi:hypothetical protein